jgi:phosphoserine phosphatase
MKKLNVGIYNRRYYRKYYCLDCAKRVFQFHYREGKHYVPISYSVRSLVRQLSSLYGTRYLASLLGLTKTSGWQTINRIIDGRRKAIAVEKLKILSNLAKKTFMEKENIIIQVWRRY